MIIFQLRRTLQHLSATLKDQLRTTIISLDAIPKLYTISWNFHSGILLDSVQSNESRQGSVIHINKNKFKHLLPLICLNMIFLSQFIWNQCNSNRGLSS